MATERQPIDELEKIALFIDNWPEQLGRELRGFLRSYRAGTLTKEQVQEKVREFVDTALDTVSTGRK